MEKKHLFNLTTEELEILVTNCVNTCLKNSKPVNLQVETEEIFTFKPAAAFLHLKEPTFRLKIKNGEVSHMKRGGKLYFSKTDLLNYLKEGRRKTAKEIAAEAENYLAERKGGIDA